MAQLVLHENTLCIGLVLLFGGLVYLNMVAVIYYRGEENGKGDSHSSLVAALAERDGLIQAAGDLTANCPLSGVNYNGGAMRTNNSTAVRIRTSCNSTNFWIGCTQNDFVGSMVLGRVVPSEWEEDFATITFLISVEPSTTIDHLNATLESFIENSSTAERLGTTIVIYLGERLERRARVTIREWIYKDFIHHLESGLLQVVQSVSDEAIPARRQRSVNVIPTATETRRGIAVDTAFVLTYCDRMFSTRYFMQLSDVVIFEKEFITSIRDFIRKNCPNPWQTLHFATLGVTGRLYRRSDVQRLGNFLVVFSPRYSIDMLYQFYTDLRSQRGNYLHTPSIFRKIDNRTLWRNTRASRRTPKTPRGAFVYSTMKPFSEKHFPEAALSRSKMFFLGMNPKPGDEVVVTLPASRPVQHIRVDTGHWEQVEGDPEGTLRDILLDGKVEISPHLEQNSADKNIMPVCKKYQTIGYSVMGSIDIGDIDRRFGVNVSCIRITVLQKQLQWLAIQRIFIWT